MAVTWIQTAFMPALRHRIEQKIRKAPDYVVVPGETLSLLLVGSIAKLGAVAATYVIAQLVSVEQLNAELHQILACSRFQYAYLHLQLSGNAVFEWSRESGWRLKRPPNNDNAAAREALDLLKAHGGFGPDGLLPGTELRGSWRP